jgi:two-component system chemotaxis sensor kinase CheA
MLTSDAQTPSPGGGIPLVAVADLQDQLMVASHDLERLQRLLEGAGEALLVDELLGQQQVVVKNLEAHYRKVHGVYGATIMGDGRIALIQDIGSLVRLTRH